MPVTDDMTVWRRCFLILEALLVLAILASVLWRDILLGMETSGHSILEGAVAAVGIGSWLFLLVASPFFLRSLRGVALTGWILAFGIALFAASPTAL
jgi:hypothetical protein